MSRWWLLVVLLVGGSLGWCARWYAQPSAQATHDAAVGMAMRVAAQLDQAQKRVEALGAENAACHYALQAVTDRVQGTLDTRRPNAD